MGDPCAPIGIFDSGVGGLTVLARIAERLPSESLVYLGDTARVPYGTKSADTVIRYAQSCARVVCGYNVKLLVVACNTASAYAIDALRDELSIPVLGVIEPGAQCAVESTRNGRIGVIGTRGTIQSGKYETLIRSLSPTAEIFSKPCPLFVPLAEEGWVDGDVPRQIVQAYLDELLALGIDTLVLGCTHYPILKPVIAEVVSEQVALVDSAEATSAVVAATLERTGGAKPPGLPGGRRFLATDDPESFSRAGKRFLGHEIDRVQWVDLG